MFAKRALSILPILAVASAANADSDPQNLPPKVYLLCFIYDNYDPPEYEKYMNLMWVSPVTVDNAPKAMSSLKNSDGGAYTKAGAQTVSDMVDWLNVKYKKPSSRHFSSCRMFDTRLEADQELEGATGEMGGYGVTGGQ